MYQSYGRPDENYISAGIPVRRGYEDSSIGDIIGRDIVFTDENNGWLLCDDGLLYRTTTGGGITNLKDDDINFPGEFILKQNYPNPFNPQTSIKYSITNTGKVELVVYDILGKKVAELVNETKMAGEYNVIFDGAEYASGLYFYKLKSGDFIQTRKMLLVK